MHFHFLSIMGNDEEDFFFFFIRGLFFSCFKKKKKVEVKNTLMKKVFFFSVSVSQLLQFSCSKKYKTKTCIKKLLHFFFIYSDLSNQQFFVIIFKNFLNQE